MLSDEQLRQLADYLTNAIDRDSVDDMSTFASRTFKLEKDTADKIIRAFVTEFSEKPLIFELEASEFIRSLDKS